MARSRYRRLRLLTSRALDHVMPRNVDLGRLSFVHGLETPPTGQVLRLYAAFRFGMMQAGKTLATMTKGEYRTLESECRLAVALATVRKHGEKVMTGVVYDGRTADGCLATF
jgi:hypothetical protein